MHVDESTSYRCSFNYYHSAYEDLAPFLFKFFFAQKTGNRADNYTHIPMLPRWRSLLVLEKIAKVFWYQSRCMVLQTPEGQKDWCIRRKKFNPNFAFNLHDSNMILPIAVNPGKSSTSGILEPPAFDPQNNWPARHKAKWHWLALMQRKPTHYTRRYCTLIIDEVSARLIRWQIDCNVELVPYYESGHFQCTKPSGCSKHECVVLLPRI